MERRLMVEAARDGKFGVIEKMLKENPSILADTRIISLEESLLHVATKSGQISFVSELLKVDADGAREVDKDGFRPLDIAVIMGNLGMVKELLKFNKDLVRLKGKDRRTALHYTAMKNRVDIVDELLISSPDSIEDVTVHEETALHLAVRTFHFDVFATLLIWIEKLGKETLINMGDGDGDGDGNTVLHYAVLTKQQMCLDLLLGENSTIRGTVNINAEDVKGLTALDIMELNIQDSYDAKIMKLLQSAAALRSNTSTTFQQETNAVQPVLSKNWFEYFKFQRERDSPSDTRNTLLVVAALIATVTFQGGVNPPSGIFGPVTSPSSSGGNLNPASAPSSSTDGMPTSPPRNPVFSSALAVASAIFGSHASSNLFLFTNSLGFTAAVCIIIYLTSRFPFRRELLISLYSLMFTYGAAVNNYIKQTERQSKTMAYVIMTVAFSIPFLQRWMPDWGRKVWRMWRRKRAITTTMLPS